MILITKGGLSRGGDNEMPENCLYDCRLRDTCIYVPRWADEETLLRIGTERSKSCPLVQVYEVPKETEQAHTVMIDRKTENSSEKPNNCEHITEDGVTCAKYPACDDCLDNPLNKVKGSERLVKGSEQTDCLDRYDHKTEPTISKMEQVEDDAYFLELMGAVERGEISDAGANQAWYEYINHKDEPQMGDAKPIPLSNRVTHIKDEP